MSERPAAAAAAAAAAADGETVLELSQVTKRFGTGGAAMRVVNDVSLSVHAGECVALVGESGSGKTTLAHLVCGLLRADSGTVRINRDIELGQAPIGRRQRRALSRHAQLVFQDPYGSLDPSKTVAAIVAEPLLLLGLGRDQITQRIRETLALVGLSEELASRKPRALSGGQRQRVGIARALGPRPRLLVLDEPVASLDVSVQGQILELIDQIRSETSVGLLVIAHDLGVVRAIADRTLVMYRGRVVERGQTGEVFSEPTHPYTQGLLWSATAEGRKNTPDAARDSLARDVGWPRDGDDGCVFRDRCWRAIADCQNEVERVERSATHWGECNVPLSGGNGEGRPDGVVTSRGR